MIVPDIDFQCQNAIGAKRGCEYERPQRIDSFGGEVPQIDRDEQGQKTGIPEPFWEGPLGRKENGVGFQIHNCLREAIWFYYSLWGFQSQRIPQYGKNAQMAALFHKDTLDFTVRIW